MTGRYEMWTGSSPTVVGVPVSGGENVMVPVVRGIVRDVGAPDRIILQRRDEPGEVVQGLLEIPGGRWHAGESPEQALRREVSEETGLEVVAVGGVSLDVIDDHRAMATTEPLAVVSGVDGAFPAAHMILLVEARGEPRPEPGESADVRWWDVADVVAAMRDDRSGFIPSSYAALEAYFAWVGRPSGDA